MRGRGVDVCGAHFFISYFLKPVIMILPAGEGEGCRTVYRCSSPLISYFSAIASISQSTPLGSAFTATQLRAGFDVKYFA